MTTKIKKLNNHATIPTKGSTHAAGFDLYASIEGGEQQIAAGETVKIGTGIAVEIPDGFFGAIFARSGIATKQGLRPANCVGVVDSDYRGEIIVALHNDSPTPQYVTNGERIAQLVILPYLQAELLETEDLSDTQRGTGGFGSTGTNIPQPSEKEPCNPFDRRTG